jgi:hypothetical protein
MELTGAMPLPCRNPTVPLPERCCLAGSNPRHPFLNQHLKLGPDVPHRQFILGRPSIDQWPRFNEPKDHVSWDHGPHSTATWTYSTVFR